MTKSTSAPPSARLDIAAIIFVLANAVAAVILWLIVKDTLEIPEAARRQHTLFLFENAGKLAGAIYAITIGFLVLVRRAPGSWISGAVVSILSGCSLSTNLDGWFLFPLLFPVSLWLIFGTRRYRQGLANLSAAGEHDQAIETPASRGRALAKLLPTLLTLALKYFGSYLLGVLGCLLLFASIPDPLDLGFNDLADLSEWGGFLIEPVQGLFFFIEAAWWVLLLILVFLICIRRRSFFRRWRPLWIGFSIGFLGTLGAYGAALQSIP